MIDKCEHLKAFRLALPVALIAPLFRLFDVLPDNVEDISVRLYPVHVGDNRRQSDCLRSVSRNDWSRLDHVRSRLKRLKMVTFLEDNEEIRSIVTRNLPTLCRRGVLWFRALEGVDV